MNLTFRRMAGFTMVEIALCLAIIGFALVAILGGLSRGMEVQQVNREETIVNQDATVWMSAIRNGARGYNDLTNYVLGITNFWTTYELDGEIYRPVLSRVDYHTRTDSRTDSGALTLWLTNGANIVGLLSTPRITPPSFAHGDSYRSNHIVAGVRSMSGPAMERPPQSDPGFLDSAFTYRMVVENASLPLYVADTNSLALARNLHANARELRLLFRYPMFPNGKIGPRRLTFRTLVDGSMIADTNGLSFIRPSTYVQAP